MGAKTPELVKQKNKPRSTVKCDVCGRKFLSISAWKSHYKFVHSKAEPNKRVAFKKQKNARQIKTKMVPSHMLKRVNPPDSTEAKKTEESGKTSQLAAKSPNVTKKAEFECPVCASKFPVYFTAFRHIQKNHCVDEKGEKVALNSPNLVKPIRIETCASCNQEIRSTTLHDCPKMQAYKDQYLCLGCEQVFCGLVLFQHHVKGMHADEVQNFFFPSKTEFEAWKKELQESINTEFIRLNKQKTKETFHCSHQPTVVSTATKLCPSTITVREYSRGIHVCYFREHCGHKANETVPLKHYDQYSIALYTRETEDLKLESDYDNDLYAEFKDMVTCITNEASKADDDTLRDLIGRALDMTTVLKNFNKEHPELLVTGKNLSDDQISKSLDNLKTKSKRKQMFEKKTENMEAKKVKKTPLSVENGVTKRHNRSSNVVKKSGSLIKSRPRKSQSTLDQEFEKLLAEDGRSTPQITTPKKTDELLKTVHKKAEELLPAADLEVKMPEEQPLLQSPSSFNDSYKNFVDQNFKSAAEKSKTKLNAKKKEIMKTKIGQFKVKPASPKNVSPRSPKIVKDDIEAELEIPVVFKAKPDIRYVVKEQENDCNILILKI